MKYTYAFIALVVLIGGAILLVKGSPMQAASEEASEARADDAPSTSKNKSTTLMRAPELVHPDGYLNTNGQPITLAQHQGEVVLVQFWTYSCINCQRTIPYLKRWYSTYKDQGLVVIGVHTPEFAYEHLKENVAKALVDEGITYPVVLDNEYQTWRSYGNQFWPHTYLINRDGNIVYDHIGEGAYDDTEDAIRKALAEPAAAK